MTEQLSAWPTADPVFRPVQYLGCKLRVLDALIPVVDDLDPDGGRLLDLFSGTGVVARRFADRRPVLAVDIQEYARVLASALLASLQVSSHEILAQLQELVPDSADPLEQAIEPLLDWELRCLEAAARGEHESLCALVENGSIERYRQGEAVADRDLQAALERASTPTVRGPESALTRYYGGVYFGYRQALELDRLATAARRCRAPLRDVALAAVMSTASELVASIGNHFAQPVRVRTAAGTPKRAAIRTVLGRRGLSVEDTFVGWLDRYRALAAPGHECLAIRADFRDALRNPARPVSVVYADPPYTRDHYSRYYHVLETIARGDEPGLSQMRLGEETVVSRGLYRTERHQSPFCIKSQAPRAFRELISGARTLGLPLVLSYSPHGEEAASRPRLMTIEQIVDIAGEHYSEVEVLPVSGVVHSKLNAAHLNFDVAYDAERLIVCRD